MQTIVIFWLPILLSAVAVWIASAVCWMALPHHKGDHRGLPDETGFVNYLKSAGIGPGNYGFPHCADRAKMKDPEFQRKWKEGPNGLLSVWGNVSMGRNMVVTFLVYLIVSYGIAFLAGSCGLRHGEPFPVVFKVLGTAGVLAYSFAFIPNQVWFGAFPRTIVMHVIDGIAYGLITGAIFAACWPRT